MTGICSLLPACYHPFKAGSHSTGLPGGESTKDRQVRYALPLIVTLYELTFFLESDLVAGELCGSLHCCHTHQVVQFRLAVRGIQESPRGLAYRHLPWSLGFPAWTHLEALQTRRRQSAHLA